MKFSPEKLNQLRLARRMTYEMLAEQLRLRGIKMKFSSVWRHCAGKNSPHADTVGAYASALEVQVQDLYEQ